VKEQDLVYATEKGSATTGVTDIKKPQELRRRGSKGRR